MKNYQKILIILVLVFSVILIKSSRDKDMQDVSTITIATSTDIFIKDKNEFYNIEARIPKELLDKEGVMENKISSIVDVKKEEWKIGGDVYLEEQNILKQFPDRVKIDYQLTIDYKKYKSDLKNSVSYVFNNYEFVGGAHGDTGIITYTYNEKGLVDIQNILNFNDGKDIDLSNILESKLKPAIGEYYNEQMLREGLGLAFLKKNGTFDMEKCNCDEFNFVSNFDNFIILNEGIKFIFGQYQVGPYAAGFPEVLLTWDELAVYLK
jgi:hypothetical protein